MGCIEPLKFKFYTRLCLSLSFEALSGAFCFVVAAAAAGSVFA